MKDFKKNLACNITLIVVLAFSVVHLLILMLGVFAVIDLKTTENFSYIVAFSLVIVCLLLYMFGFFITKQAKLIIPSWISILFYVAFFLFTNTYYILGAYQNIWCIALLFMYISMLVTLLSLSLFYNIQKDEKGRLIVSAKYLTVTVFLWSTAINSIIQFVVSFVKNFGFETYKFSNLSAFVVEYASMLLVSIMISVLFYLSLNRTKQFVNSCLVKVNHAKK